MVNRKSLRNCEKHFYEIKVSIIFIETPSFAKLRQAISCIGVEENQKYCFGELGNTNSMNLNLIYLLFR
jgi:hypothetical protein